MRALGALAVHAALVVWLSWPLAANLTTHLPDTWSVARADTLHIAWVLAYQSHRLVTAPWQLPAANIYHPTPDALFYGETGYGAVPFFLPTFVLSNNPALALNLTFLAAVALTAWTLHLVVGRWTGSALAGLIAGWTFLTSRWVLWTWFPIVPHYAVLLWFPLIMWAVATPDLRPRRLAWLLPLVVLQSLDTVYVAASLLAPLGLLGLARLPARATRRAGLRLLVLVGLAALALAGVYSGHLMVRAANPAMATQTAWPSVAARTMRLPWEPLASGAPMGVPSAALALIALGALGAAARRRGGAQVPGGPAAAWRQGAFWAVAGLAISLTPVVRWDGTVVHLPHFYLARLLPVYDVLREPHRLGVAGLMGLAVLAGAAFGECEGWLRARGGRAGAPLAAGLAGLLMAVTWAQYDRGVGMKPSVIRGTRSDYAFGVRLPASYPLQAAIAPVSPLIATLRAPGGPLLEVPAPGGIGLPAAIPHAQAMYRSIFHWRPLLNGYHGYWPAGFPERLAVAARLPDPDALRTLRDETGLAVVLVHGGRLAPAPRAAWLAAAAPGAREDLRLLGRDGEDLLFAVTIPPA